MSGVRIPRIPRKIEAITEMMMTKSRKLVPQRLWRREALRTFSTVRSQPFSMQLMHLCSAPWNANTRWISFMREIRNMYVMKMHTRSSASATETPISETPNLRRNDASR